VTVDKGEPVAIELDARRRALLMGSLLAVTLHAFDELSVVTALPVIVADLGGRALYGAAFFSYVLASIIGLVGAGWLATRYGPGRPLAWGFAVFAFGLGLAAIAPSMLVVVVARSFQGLGGGILNTVVLVIVNRTFESAERPRVMAWMTTAWVVPALLAPAIAGTVAESIGWRWVFAGLLPAVAIAAVLALPATRSLQGSQPERSFADESSGGIRLAVGLGLMLSGLAQEMSWWIAAEIAIGGAIALPALVKILPAGVLRAAPIVPAALATKFLLAFAFFGTEGFLPLALTEIHSTTATYAGLSLTTAALSWSGAALMQARLADRHSSRMLGMLGCSIVAVSIGSLHSVLDPHTTPALALGLWAMAGAGMGIAYNTISTTAMAHSPKGKEGELSTSLGVADALGISLGTGVAGALIAFGDRASWATSDSLGIAWLGMGAVAAVAVAASRRLGSGVVGKLEQESTGAPTQPLTEVATNR
jgi:MFS family permease